MSITVTLYSFTKRENSTKHPISGGTDYSCIMMDDTSLMNPVFKLSIANNPIGKNYCYVSSFNRYYFITNIRTYQNFWYIECKCDVLASFKTEIGNQTHYILRSASDYDGTISDTLYVSKTNETASISVPASPDTDPLLWGNGHSYVLGIVGDAGSSTQQVGSVVYYHMDAAALQEFISFLMNNVEQDWSNLYGEYSQGVIQALLNPMQYIVSCMLIPVDPPDNNIDPRPSTIKFGYYEYTTGSIGNIAVLYNSAPVIHETSKIVIPKHPQAATRGSYLNCQPFSTYVLHYGPYGDIPLDPMLMQRNTNLLIDLLFDMFTGECRLLVKGNENSGDIFYSGTTQIGVAINLSQVYVDGLAQTQAETNAIFNMVGAALSGTPSGFASIASAATSGIQDATRLNFPTVSGLTSGGSYIPFFDSYNCYLQYKYTSIVDENLAEIGRPLCQCKQINTLSGFILCQLADAQISGTAEEAIQINEYMNSGFYYE